MKPWMPEFKLITAFYVSDVDHFSVHSVSGGPSILGRKRENSKTIKMFMSHLNLCIQDRLKTYSVFFIYLFFLKNHDFDIRIHEEYHLFPLIT